MAGTAQPLPHRYRARAAGAATGPVTLASDGVADLASEAPPEFGGPQGYWSPETLFAAAIADCYILSFRAVARASKLEWLQLDVDVEALLERADGVTRFTRVTIAPRLGIPPGVPESAAIGVLEKAKRVCLVTNSLNSECALATLVYSVVEAGTAG